MDSGRISKRYAKAAYEFALKKGEEEKLYKEMIILVENFHKFHALKKAMEDPTISSEDKKKLLSTAAGISTSESFSCLLNIIEKNRRETYALTIALMYMEYYRKQQGIVICFLSTVEPASEKIRKGLEVLIRTDVYKKVDFINRIRPEIIGGFIVKLNDYQLDASVKSQLNKLKKQLVN